jgi:hypothetical protein
MLSKLMNIDLPAYFARVGYRGTGDPTLATLRELEVQAFADVNVAWLMKLLTAAAIVKTKDSQARARAIYSAVAGAQLFARGRSDISLFDTMIDNYRTVGLLPA